jgi:8-oxo-dGTP diphosphatase
LSSYIQWLRAQAGPALLPLVYTTAIIRDPAGRVLMQRRSDFGDAWWGLPGGLFEPGETPEACLRREVLEETGLQAAPRRLSGLYASLRYQVNYPNGDQAQQITACYDCDWLAGQPRPQPGEVEELQFFAPGALPPTSLWYADMLTHALAGRSKPYFDLPEPPAREAIFPTALALRPLIGAAPLLWPGAGAVVFDEAGRMLFQRRADDGTWSWPGGYLDTGETPAHTAARETREETGLEVEPVRLLTISAGYRAQYANGDEVYPVVSFFICRLVGGLPRADGNESTEVGFFARDTLPPLVPRRAALAQQAFAAHDAAH